MELKSICIYSKQAHDDAELKSGDHVLLAAIGGIKKLPKSYVSHEVNNYFSNLEKHFTRDSIISISRQFEGPGKRGNLNIKNASKSNICVMLSNKASEDLREKYMLGYLELGKPYIINQFILTLDKDKENISTSINPELLKEGKSHQEILMAFLERVKKSTNYILIKDDNLPNSIALFGEFNGKWFLGIKNDSIKTLASDYINYLRDSKSVAVNDYTKSSSQVTVYQHAKIDFEATSRVMAKMVFNFLAFEMGHEFVLNPRFDLIRNWIYTGEGKNNFVHQIDSSNIMKELFATLYPERAHYIFISEINNELVGLIGFYGSTFSFSVKLTDLIPSENLIPNLRGLICDWKNRKEYTLSEYLQQLT